MTLAIDRIKIALRTKRQWFTSRQIIDVAKVASGECSALTRQLVSDGAVQAMHPPKGYAKGCQYIYAAAGVEPLEGASRPGSELSVTLRRLPKKMIGFRAAAKAERAKHKKQRALAPDTRVTLTTKGRAIIGDDTPRWAPTSDGALILLDTGVELSKPAARSLIEFVRTLDAGAA